MACRLGLPIWPTALNCVSWSRDNSIAIGAGDQIAVLTPRLAPQNDLNWHTAIFKANEFTAEEVPQADPLSFQNFSIGEELSLRHVHALEWSPPGLSRFGGCVLAVLSTNHVLSIWECDGKPDVDAHWVRKAIVNHAVQAYYGGLDQDMNGTNDKTKERTQVCQRIRAFAWSPPVYEEMSNDARPYVSSVGQHHQFLSLATEVGDVVLVRVQSPYNILVPSTRDWSIEIIQVFNISDHAVFASDTAKSKELPGKPLIADHLAWGDWTSGESHISYVAGGQLYCVKVMTDFSKSSEIMVIPGKSKNLTEPRSDMAGPLKFIPNTSLLTAFAVDRVYCIDLFADPTIVTFHHLDDRWDEVSGLAVTKHGPETIKMHITSHLSSATAPTSTLPLPLEKDAVSIPPSWQDAIIESKATFSSQCDLDGHVMERVWGIAASPLGEYIVTATTMLPSDSIAHMVPSDRTTIVNISQESNIGDCLARFGSNTSTESLIFSLQRHFDQQPSPEDPISLIKAIMNCDDYSTGCSENLGSIGYLRQQVVMNPDVRTARAKFLSDFVYRGPNVSTTNQLSKLVVERLVTTGLNVSDGLECGGPMSTKIRQIYKRIARKLDPVQCLECIADDSDNWREECQICQEDISFESVKWARCEAGHQFARCALTFLAIQKPAISKHCAVCGTQYLNEWRIPELSSCAGEEDIQMTELAGHNGTQTPPQQPEQELGKDNWEQDGLEGHEPVSSGNGNGCNQVSQEREPEGASSLARTLYAAFDACIYCGGKFVS